MICADMMLNLFVYSNKHLHIFARASLVDHFAYLALLPKINIITPILDSFANDKMILFIKSNKNSGISKTTMTKFPHSQIEQLLFGSANALTQFVCAVFMGERSSCSFSTFYLNGDTIFHFTHIYTTQ